ncbi:MAG TPA: serine/threonine-protein kinase, partial [Pyrinomonadaceae bacterium]
MSDDGNDSFLQAPVAEKCLAALAAEGGAEDAGKVPPPLPPASDLIGREIGGRYRIVSSLRPGGFGEVYKAIDTKLHSRFVVIKILQRHLLSDDPARRDWIVRKFKQEIEALAKIKHPGVVGIFDTDILDGRPYIVMEFIEGMDLREFIKTQCAFEQGIGLSQVAEIVKQVGRTLTASHDSGIIHRDLKPENIMVRQSADGDLQVKVIDFGIAKIRNSLIASSTTSGHVAGTWP